MIQPQSVLKVSDNSGAKSVRCLKVLGGFKKKYAKLGDIVIVSVQKVRNNSKKTSRVNRKEIYKALILRTKTIHRRKTGYESFFKENAVALLNKQGNPVGTRVLGPVPKSLKKNLFQKFISISAGVV
jgi:large subunit ribosomal protein L14